MALQRASAWSWKSKFKRTKRNAAPLIYAAVPGFDSQTKVNSHAEQKGPAKSFERFSPIKHLHNGHA